MRITFYSNVDAHALVIKLFDVCCQGLILQGPWRQGLQQPHEETTAVNVQHPAHPAQVQVTRFKITTSADRQSP